MAALPYSKFTVSRGFVFISGHIHTDSEGKLIDGTIEEKTHRVMLNIKETLEKAGVTFADVVKTSIFLTDMKDYAKVNEVYAGYLTEPYPARETVSVKELPGGATVEISMIAVKK